MTRNYYFTQVAVRKLVKLGNQKQAECMARAMDLAKAGKRDCVIAEDVKQAVKEALQTFQSAKEQVHGETH